MILAVSLLISTATISNAKMYSFDCLKSDKYYTPEELYQLHSIPDISGSIGHFLDNVWDSVVDYCFDRKPKKARTSTCNVSNNTLVDVNISPSIS
jgi:hypothetical protein